MGRQFAFRSAFVSSALFGVLLLTGAAVTRVFGPLVLPAAATTDISALLWVSAFALFCFVYAPILTRPRRGGGDG